MNELIGKTAITPGGHHGTIVAIGYHYDGVKSYHRGFDVLILRDDNTLEKHSATEITIKPN